MDKDKALRMALEALENNRQTHNYCEDTWYSCPKHEEGCANESEGDECNCGADEANAEIDKAITAIKEVLAQSDQESDGLTIAYMAGFYDGKNKDAPQRKPLTDEEISDMWCEVSNTDFVTGDTHVFARAIEAKLREKNT